MGGLPSWGCGIWAVWRGDGEMGMHKNVRILRHQLPGVEEGSKHLGLKQATLPQGQGHVLWAPWAPVVSVLSV